MRRSLLNVNHFGKQHTHARADKSSGLNDDLRICAVTLLEALQVLLASLQVVFTITSVVNAQATAEVEPGERQSLPFQVFKIPTHHSGHLPKRVQILNLRADVGREAHDAEFGSAPDPIQDLGQLIQIDPELGVGRRRLHKRVGSAR